MTDNTHITLEGYQATPINVERAEAAAVALRIYTSKKGEEVTDMGTLRDLLQDALHWMAQNGEDNPAGVLLDMVAVAINDFPEEFSGDPQE